MKQAILSLALVGLIIVELWYFDMFNIFEQTKNLISILKQSEFFLFFLQLSLVFIVIALVILYIMQRKIEQKKVSLNFNNKMTRSQYEKELQKETRRQVDALTSSEAYKRHKQLFQSSEEFVNQRNLTQDEDLSDILTESDSGQDSEENHQ